MASDTFSAKACIGAPPELGILSLPMSCGKGAQQALQVSVRGQDVGLK